MTTRIILHFRCILARPRHWRFYCAGIARELHLAH